VRRRLLISYLSITLFVLLALALPLGLAFSQTEDRRLASRIQDDAYGLALQTGTPLQQGDTATLGHLVHQFAGRVQAAIVVVDARGVVLASGGSAEPRPGATTVGVVFSMIRAARCDTSCTQRQSTMLGKCGPCCSVAPIGTMTMALR